MPSRRLPARLYGVLRRATGPTRWRAGCLYLGAGLLTLRQLRAASIVRWEAYDTAECNVAAGLEDWESRVYRDVLHPSYRVLLVGCGTGRDLIELVRLGCEVVGLEQSPMLADRAREHLGRLGLAGFVVAEPVESYVTSATYDAVVFSLYMYSYIIGTASRIAVLTHARAQLIAARADHSQLCDHPAAVACLDLPGANQQRVFRQRLVAATGRPAARTGVAARGAQPGTSVFAGRDRKRVRCGGPPRDSRRSDQSAVSVRNCRGVRSAASAITASHTSPSRRSRRGKTSRRIGMSVTSRDAMANWFARRDRSTWIRLKAARVTSRNASSPPSGTMVTRDAPVCARDRQAHRAIEAARHGRRFRRVIASTPASTLPALSRCSSPRASTLLCDRGEQLQPGRAGVRDPHSVSLLEREHVVGQEVKAARDESGPDRRLAVTAVAKKTHGLTVDHHRGGMQRLASERQQRERQNLTEQVRRERFLRRSARAFDSAMRAAVGRDKELEEVLPTQIGRAVWKPAALEPISGRRRRSKAAAGVVESMRRAGAKPHIRPAACGDPGAREGNRAFERESVEAVSRSDPDHVFAPEVLVLGLPEPSFALPPLAAVSLRKSPCTFSVGERYGCFAGDGSRSLPFHALSC